LEHPLISSNELYGLSQPHGRFCQFILPGICTLFGAYPVCIFFADLTVLKVTITPISENSYPNLLWHFVFKQCLLWCSISHHFCIVLSTVVQAWRAIHFPWWKFCLLHWDDRHEDWGKFCQLL